MIKFNRFFFSLLCILSAYDLYSQTTCSDSVITRKFTNDNWKDLELLYGDPMVTMRDSGIILSLNVFDSINLEGVPSGGNSVLVKFNSTSGISWSKMKWITDKERVVIRTLSVLNNGDILIQGNISVFISNVNYRHFLGRVDSSGKLKWLRLYKENSIDLRKFSESTTGDLYVYSGRINNFPAISRLTSSGDEIWSSVFQLNGIPEFNASRLFSIKAVDSILYAFYSNYTWREGYRPEWRSSVCLLKIGLKDGKLLENKSYYFPEKHNYYIDIPSFYDDVEGRFIIWGAADSDTANMLFRMEVDKNLDVTHADQVRYLNRLNSDVALLNLSPSSGNLIGTLAKKNDPTKLNYFSLDQAMSILFQRRLQLEKGARKTFALENLNGRITLVSFYYGNVGNPYFTVTDFSTDFFTNTGCSGKDTSLFSLPEVFHFLETKISVSKLPYKIESISANLTGTDYPLNEETICRQINICDSIRITGPDVVCNIDEPQYFDIEMRDECLKKVEWQIDSVIAYPPEIINGNRISIRFKKSATEGVLKAAISTCDIVDSLKIFIAPAQNIVDLGKDTALCNNTITLRAGRGYQAYQWQDGSTSDTLDVSFKGKYWVHVIDYCGRESSDTILVKQTDLTFSAGINRLICLYDTVNLYATEGYHNYQWNPSSSLANQHMNTATAFPEVTTKYVVSAERFPQCVVKDSVVVSVKECPRQIFFPNAFSPNNDGLNDNFKPAIEGSISHYRLSIYNRYGQVVFQSEDPSKGWDGYFKGQQQPVGLYGWVCEYAFRGQGRESLKGRLYLLR